MNFIQCITRNVILTFFCVLPLFVHGENNPNRPIQQSHYYQDDINDDNSSSCCEPCDPCGSRNCCWDSIKTPLIIGISAVGGGAIGAALSSGKRGGHGDDGDPGAEGPQGPQGPTGPTGPGFTVDTGNSLTFRLTSLFPASPAGSVTVIPFVTSPNGTTVEGPAIVSPTAGGTIVFSDIVVHNPVFGIYNFGVAIFNTSATTLAGITLNQSLVIATRDGSSTTELTPLAGVSVAPGESQVSNTFTYDQTNVP